jgi:D-glycero-alpha-D-manno-heptose-7-phosphate kinase
LRIRSKAPLRLGFGGGGTDVSPYADIYGGAILNATIGMYAYCHIDETVDDAIHFESRDYDARASYPVSARLEPDGTLDLFKCVYNRLRAQFDVAPRGFRLVTHSDAPYGSGLGGSSTLVVAMVRAFAEWWRLPLGEYDIARLAFDIERVDAGLKGGKQDQYAASFGGVNFMEFYGDRVIVNPLRVKDAILTELEASLVLCFTGRSRESAHIIEDQIANASKGHGDSLDAMHRVKEDAREMKEALLMGQLPRFASILDRAWQNKKRMAGTITNPHIDELDVFARSHGALAGKVSGAGGGGFMMFFVDAMDRHDLRVALEGRGHSVLPVAFTSSGAAAWGHSNG